MREGETYVHVYTCIYSTLSVHVHMYNVHVGECAKMTTKLLTVLHTCTL